MPLESVPGASLPLSFWEIELPKAGGVGKQQAEKGRHSVYFRGAFDVRVDLDLLYVRSAQGSSEGPTADSPLVLMLHDHICHVRALALLSVVLALLRPPQCFSGAPFLLRD